MIHSKTQNTTSQIDVLVGKRQMDSSTGMMTEFTE